MTIELINSTPFVPLQFESIDTKLNMFRVVVLRGSFDIVHRKRLRLAAEQETLILEDQYFGDSASSSMRFDSALSPYKPRTDVLIEATAYSPSGKAENSWVASVKAGDCHKSFLVTGPREWNRKLGFARLSEIEPISSLPVRYEHAFGGIRSDGERFGRNPVGVGFENKIGEKPIAVPQILSIEEGVPVFGKTLTPVGLGPIPPSWEPRLQRAGTYDDHWKATRAPYLPQDFSFEFYNVASEGLSFPGFAQGNELFRLENLSQERELEFGLPQIELLGIVQFEDGRLIPTPIHLDTVEIQVEQKKVYLQWRGILPAQIPTRAIEVRMSAPEYMIEN